MIPRPWTPTLVALALLAACTPSTPPDDGTVAAELLTGPDLHAILVTGIGEGEARVYLPTDIRPGDAFSGAIDHGGAPLTRADSTRDNPYSRYAIVVGEVAIPLSARLGKWTAPTAGDGVDVLVRHTDGQDVARVRVPFEAVDSAATSTASQTAPVGQGRRGPRFDSLPRLPDSTVNATSLGVQGRGVIAIAGKFDGDISTSRARLEPAVRILAESPRRIVLFDQLILRGGPQRVTCCAEGGPCGLTSCCVDIPSNGCTFCQFNDYPVCITGPVAPG